MAAMEDNQGAIANIKGEAQSKNIDDGYYFMNRYWRNLVKKWICDMYQEL